MDVRKFINQPNELAIFNKYDLQRRQSDIVSSFDIVGFIKGIDDIKCFETINLPSRVSGLIKKQQDGFIYIYVSQLDTRERQRFTLAHELGHYFRHRDELEKGFVDGVGLARDNSHNTQEYEANEFAAEILMPEDIFKSAWNDPNYQMQSLSLLFNVSMAAIATRAKLLNLLEDGQQYMF